MNSKHKKVYEEIFKAPVQSSIKWDDIEKLLLALGAEISEGNGSSVGVISKEAIVDLVK